MKISRPPIHNRDHRRGGADAINGRWYYVGEADASAFENSWTNSGGGMAVLRYGLDDDELVIVGDITGGEDGTVVFTLPASHTPDESHPQPGVSVDGVPATILIGSDGTVTVTLGTGGGGGSPTGAAGGVLSGTYPNPGFASDMATQAELDAHTGDTSAAHAASAISADSTTLVGTGTDVQAVLEELDNAVAALGTPPPANADYLVGTANAGLSAEIVVGTTPGGELGGTWASPTVDASHSGSTHAAVQAAAEATAAAALSAHEADTTSVHGIADTSALYRAGGTDVAVADGGTGSSTAGGARTNLGAQAQDADLDAIAALSPSNDDIIQRKAGVWTNRTMAQLAADLPSTGAPWFYALDYATGDGSTDDSTALGTALTAATGGTLVFGPGTYIHQNVTVPANTTLILLRGATLKLKASASQSGLLFSNAGSTLIGPGTLDGNRANQSSNQMPVYVSASHTTIDGVKVTGSKYHGIHLQTGSHLRVENCYVTDCANTGIYLDPSGTAISDVLIANNTVDRSAESAATIAGEGIQCYSDGSFAMRYLRIEGNHCFMPTSPTAEVSPISVIRASYSTVTGNTCSGGQLGITFDVCTYSAMVGNTAYNQSNYGLEIADCTYTTVSGNTADGNSLATRGIALTGTGGGCFDCTVTGNTVKSPTLYGIGQTNGGRNTISSNTIYLSGTSDVNGIDVRNTSNNSVVGNRITDAYGDNKAIVLAADGATSCNYNTVVGNQILCNTGNLASRGIRFTCAHASGHVDHNLIDGNNIRGNNGSGSHGISMAVTVGGGTIDGTLIGPNKVTNVVTPQSETGTTNTTNADRTFVAASHITAAGDITARVSQSEQVSVGSAGGGAGLNFGTSLDTNLYRSAADTLKTDDALIVVGSVTAGSYVIPYAAYTPTWTATGTAPAIGNAVVVARYIQIGKWVHAYGAITFGTTSTFGTGNYRFALPVAASANLTNLFSFGNFTIKDASTGNFLSSAVGLWITSTTLQVQYGASYLGADAAVGQTQPWTWAQGDQIWWNLTYEAA